MTTFYTRQEQHFLGELKAPADAYCRHSFSWMYD